MQSVSVAQLCTKLDEWAPLKLAESWDNVGLLIGDTAHKVKKIMTCLTLTEDVADEAIAAGVDLVVTHHPLPFRPVSRVTTETVTGRVLWKVIRSGMAVYSAHTAYDSAAGGANEQWATRLGLSEIRPLAPSLAQPAVGTGRLGRYDEPLPLSAFAERVCDTIDFARVRLVGDDAHPVKTVFIGCGSGGSMIDAALAKGADTVVTGEATFHQLLSARGVGAAVVLTGHYASERFTVEALAVRLGAEFPEIECWASRHETDPVRTLP